MFFKATLLFSAVGIAALLAGVVVVPPFGVTILFLGFSLSILCLPEDKSPKT